MVSIPGQSEAIEQLVGGLQDDEKHQVLQRSRG
jgi:hypothetical protein